MHNRKKIKSFSSPNGPSTSAVHSGADQAIPYHSVIDPLVQTSVYSFKDTADMCDFMEAHKLGDTGGRVEYGRYGNPTIQAVESRLAALEGADKAILTSSGMSAITSSLLTLLSNGDHIVMTDDCYRRTREFCLNHLNRLGIKCSVVPIGDYKALETAILPETRMLVSETPTNPYLRVLDLERFVSIAHKHGVLTLVDATFATPINLRPLDYGVDLVMHSATKYLAGHNDILAGVVAGNEDIITRLRDAFGVFGTITDPNTAFLLSRGLKTLGLRIAQQNKNGQMAAEFLDAQPRVKKVWYPGLPSHPDYAEAARQMKGFGGVVSFTLNTSLQQTSCFVDALRIPLIAPSFGGVESLVGQPTLMSYYDYSPEERQAIGIEDSLVRLSLGIEDADDLIADLSQAINTID